ncbi:MAG TPA: MBL fold metallo-hydrolase, partial [Chryseolinea sp.]|nr:MBL fold metallo-hydrolase [Chryseolinea sp.]
MQTVDESKKTQINKEEVFRVDRGVWGIKDTFVNCYVIQHNETNEWILVDAGLKWSAPKIMAMAAKLFGADSGPSAIVLTHGHFDHVGSLPHLLEAWPVPVFAHELEMPYITGLSSYPPVDPTVGGGMIASLSFIFPKGPIDITPHVSKLPSDGTVPGFPEWRFIHTPGVAPGHISLFRAHDRLLLAGDAFLTTKAESTFHAVTYKETISGPPKYATCDWTMARASLEKLVALRPEVVATGHGRPMRGSKMRKNLELLLHNFEQDAIPASGRYVNEPAVTNKFGVASCPVNTETIPAATRRILSYSAIAMSAAMMFFQKLA